MGQSPNIQNWWLSAPTVVVCHFRQPLTRIRLNPEIAEQIASAVPNVKQVANNLQVKGALKETAGKVMNNPKLAEGHLKGWLERFKRKSDMSRKSSRSEAQTSCLIAQYSTI